MKDIHRNALSYIRNAGGSPEVAWFDEDHEPIGSMLRRDLKTMGVATERVDPLGGRRIELTDAGREILRQWAADFPSNRSKP